MTWTPTLIVFDCDGTLVDSQYLIVEAMRHAFADAELAPPERAEILRTAGLSIPEALKYLAPEQLPATRDELCSYYREWCTILRRQMDAKEPLFPGAASFLFNLAARDDFILGIATGKSRRAVGRFIEQHGLLGIFSTIQTADDAPSKPHPAMLMQAMEETGASPETAVMIGDTAYDMIMAACANVASIGVTWGYHSVTNLKRAGAKTIVRSFAALAQELETRQPVVPQYEAVA
ncbi:MAG: HAD-IA family hydrolase [Rhodomicrobium sp.]|nr:HAD-IA family hydrolase [Rhodomicrobium sp.]